MYNRLILIYFWGFMIEQTKRQSNIELLRNFAALGVTLYIVAGKLYRD